MTAPATVHPEWPTFRTWQLARAQADPARRRRLLARWRVIAAYLMREAMRRVMARLNAVLRPAMEAIAAACRAMVVALRPAIDAFAKLAASLPPEALGR